VQTATYTHQPSYASSGKRRCETERKEKPLKYGRKGWMEIKHYKITKFNVVFNFFFLVLKVG
jgi:hypothetical protein